MIHLEFILNEQKHDNKSTHSVSDAQHCRDSIPSKGEVVPEHFKDDELELCKFKEIWAKTVKSKISDKVMHQLYHAICDEKMEHVQFEKFNRLCDLFFFTPGKALKNKNDSNQLYQIMSSMQTDKAMVLTKKVRIILKFIIFRPRNKSMSNKRLEQKLLKISHRDSIRSLRRSEMLSDTLIGIMTMKYPTRSLELCVRKWI